MKRAQIAAAIRALGEMRPGEARDLIRSIAGYTKMLPVKFTPAQVECYKAKAERAGVSLAEWARGRLDA
jgi:hypothetical protein